MFVTNVIVSHPRVSYICSVNKDTEVNMTDAMATVVLRCFRIRMEFIYISMAMPLNIYCIFSLIIHVRIKIHAHILTNLYPFSKDVNLNYDRMSIQSECRSLARYENLLNTRPITYIYRFKQSWEHILSPIQYVKF